MYKKQNWHILTIAIFPFLIAGGTALGALLGISFLHSFFGDESPITELEGAASALMMLICILTAFTVTAFTMIAAKLLHRRVRGPVAPRFALSIAGGIAVGMLGMNGSATTTAIAWLLLLVVPFLLTWSRNPADSDKN